MNERIVQSALRVQGQKKLPPKSKLRPEYIAMWENGKGKRVLKTNPKISRISKNGDDINEDIISNTEQDLQYVWLYIFTYYKFM